MPWITPSILEEALGELATEAASRYLVEHLPGRYAFREQFSRSAISHHLCHSIPDSPLVIGQWVLHTTSPMLCMQRCLADRHSR